MSTFVAQQMLKQKVSSSTAGLKQPLIAKNENGGGDEENQQGEGEGGEENDEELEDTLGITDYTIMTVAFVSRTRGWINKLRGSVNQFAEENGKLTVSIDDLEEQNDSLKDFEVGLNAIVGSQGTNVDKLVGLVRENREIIDRMKKIVQGEITQILVRAILIADKDSNFNLDDKDVTTVLMRLDNIEFLEVDKPKFRAFVKSHEGRMGDALNLVYNLFLNEEDIPSDEQNIFKIECAF